MKKLIVCVIALCMMISLASAEDLSSLSFDQLLTLQKEVTAELISRPEWKEVTVPAGTWTIGTDIPAGFYSIKNTSDSLNLVETDGLYKALKGGEIVGKTEFKEGSSFECYYAVILAPAVSLGF